MTVFETVLKEFYWENGFVCRRSDGKIFKYPRANGKHYVKISHKGATIQYHNVVWMLTKGEIPENFTVDHIDRNKLNNQPENLRLATKQQQVFNRRGHGKTAKCKGVYFHRRSGKYIARAMIDGKDYYLGGFTDEEVAGVAYLEFVKNYHKEFTYDSI